MNSLFLLAALVHTVSLLNLISQNLRPFLQEVFHDCTWGFSAPRSHCVLFMLLVCVSVGL